MGRKSNRPVHTRLVEQMQPECTGRYENPGYDASPYRVVCCAPSYDGSENKIIDSAAAYKDHLRRVVYDARSKEAATEGVKALGFPSVQEAEEFLAGIFEGDNVREVIIWVRDSRTRRETYRCTFNRRMTPDEVPA